VADLRDFMVPPTTRTLTDQVVRLLRTQIILGHLPPGEPLVEQRLAAQLEVSRSTIREAFRRLEAESLVDTTSHRGSKVAQIDLSDAQEICDVYILLETHAVRKLSLPIDADVRTTLSRIVEQMHDVRFPDEVDRFIDLDHAFHRAIVAATAHRRLQQLWYSSSALLGILVALSIRYIEVDGPTVAQRHSAIVSALAGPDTAAAEQALTSHYLSLAEIMQSIARSDVREGKDGERFLRLRP
jgi:DNA-binding GntR family transcriptional regulator